MCTEDQKNFNKEIFYFMLYMSFCEKICIECYHVVKIMSKGVSTPELDSNRFANRIDRCESKSHSMRIHRVYTTSSTTDEAVSTCMFAHDSHAYTNSGWRYRELH